MRAVGSRRQWTNAGCVAFAGALLLNVPTMPALAQTKVDKVRISDLEDIDFGLLDPSADARRFEDVCIFSDRRSNGYSVTALGVGGGFGFTMTGLPGLVPLEYEVEWNDQPGRQNGRQLLPGRVSGGFTTDGSGRTCRRADFETASLIIVIRATAMVKTVNNISYNGTLVLTIAPE